LAAGWRGGSGCYRSLHRRGWRRNAGLRPLATTVQFIQQTLEFIVIDQFINFFLY
jgi:hypothetical protein